ncbi:MAG: dihydropteroate synthase [Candidatus Thalassarchaeaceae archaeon]|jgi:dihydropteroate synthase|nr:dihydropteroate synthase [Candidatus Thalassarchaeaceae archaeon]
MGILNVTPDSFHAASRVDLNSAIKRGLEMWTSGADWMDVGGESTRPGAEPVDSTEEMQRVVPVIKALRLANPDGLISIDTRRVDVARAALDAGANMVNDVSGLRDPKMFDLVLERGCAVCIMHMQGEPGNMQSDPSYNHVVEEVYNSLHSIASTLVEKGHDPNLICLDPGIGFGKTLTHNLELLHSRSDSEYSILWGVSRKSMFTHLLGREKSDQRLAGTLGVAAHAMLDGVDILRVHDVEEHSDLLTTLATLRPEVGA